MNLQIHQTMSKKIKSRSIKLSNFISLNNKNKKAVVLNLGK